MKICQEISSCNYQLNFSLTNKWRVRTHLNIYLIVTKDHKHCNPLALFFFSHLKFERNTKKDVFLTKTSIGLE